MELRGIMNFDNIEAGRAYPVIDVAPIYLDNGVDVGIFVDFGEDVIVVERDGKARLNNGKVYAELIGVEKALELCEGKEII